MILRRKVEPKHSTTDRFLVRYDSETWKRRPDVFKFEPIFIFKIKMGSNLKTSGRRFQVSLS